jgi:hypothetical protein
MTQLPMMGGCNCGAVRYEVTAPLVAASYCHCPGIRPSVRQFVSSAAARRPGSAPMAPRHPGSRHEIG